MLEGRERVMVDIATVKEREKGIQRPYETHRELGILAVSGGPTSTCVYPPDSISDLRSTVMSKKSLGVGTVCNPNLGDQQAASGGGQSF